MVGATTGGAGMMAVLNPVPLGQRQSLHSDGQHRTGATSGRSDFRLRTLLAPPEMEAATQSQLSPNTEHPARTPWGLSIELRGPSKPCGFAFCASMVVVFVPPFAQEPTFSPRPGGSRVPVAPVPPAVATPTSIPPTFSQHTIWRQKARAGWRAARHRS